MGRRVFVAGLLSVVAVGCAATTDKGRPLANGTMSDADPGPTLERLENLEVGYSLAYPRDWHVTGRVVATEFAGDAQCESVQVIDSGSPPQSGSVAEVLRSFVQVCRRPVTDGMTLGQFMRRTYGKQLPLFESSMFGGRSAFRTRSQETDATIFAQTDAHRLQVVASVEADARPQPQRLREVQDILDSFVFIG